jgi:protease-4
VLAFVRDQAASGGYWAAASADEIIADSGAMTGSIGVIFGPLKYYNGVIEEGSSLFGNVVTQNGIETTYITGGGGKDVGNPYRKITEEELRILQTSVSNEYDKFVEFVSKRRGISALDIKNKVKAHIYGNAQAIDLKLIDASGNRTTAFDRLKELAKVSDYKVVQVGSDLGFWDALFGMSRVGSGSQNASGSAGAAGITATGQGQSTLVKTCVLCGQMLVLHGNPEDYKLVAR